MQPSIFIDDDIPPPCDTRRPTWTPYQLGMGLALLAILRGIAFISSESIAAVPFWLRMSLGALLPQLLLLALPLVLARRGHESNQFHWPSSTKIVVEAAVSVPVIIGMLLLTVTVGLVLSRVSPRTSFTPAVLEQAAQAHNVALVIVVAVLAVTVAPICEEVFFRGFLHNALRARMPLLLAAFIQSLIFAVAHTFGAMHSTAVFFLGLILTAVYTWRQTLLAPIFLHTGINLISSMGLVAILLASANTPVLGVFGHDHPKGCQVDQVAPDSAAARAGIAPGDIITNLDGQPVAGFGELTAAIRQHNLGDSVKVELLRDGEHLESEVVLGRRP